MTSSRKIAQLLFFTVLITTVLPLIAALYFLETTLETSLNLGFNSQITHALEVAKQSLKTLKASDPVNADKYREQFEDVENLSFVYSRPEFVRKGLLDSLRLYFVLGLLVAILISIFVAIVLSRRISKSYKVTFDDLTRQREKVRYLEEISSWQELAKMLAHEIKNPLTPIEMLISSLGTSFEKKSPGDFREHLAKTESMIREEVGHLKSVVNKFSEFAKVPKVQPIAVSLFDILDENVRHLTKSFDQAEFYMANANGSRVMLDRTLFRQVLFNLAKNGVEANADRKVRFNISVQDESDCVSIVVSNDGVPVSDALADRIFDPYVSSKSGKDNMGLGLAIVKKIMIEHGGDISYEEESGHPQFKLTIKRENS